MDEINLQNYEAWYLDHLEGRLSSVEQRVLRDFLDARPELKAELEEWDDTTLMAPSVSFGNTGPLKKSEDDARDLLFFRAAEGELTEAERADFERLSAKSEFREAYANWKRAKLASGDAALEKDGLYRLGLDRPVSDFNFEYYTIAAAEGLLDEAGEKALADYIGDDPERRRALSTAEGLRLQAPTGIFFPGKESLHRKKRRGALVLVLRAAAALLLLAISTFVYNALLSPAGTDDPGIAEKKEKVETTAPEEKDAETALPSDTTSVKTKSAGEKAIPEKDKVDDSAEPEEDETLPEYVVREPDEPMMAEGTAPVQEASGKDEKVTNTPTETLQGHLAEGAEPLPAIGTETELAEAAPELMTPKEADPIHDIPNENLRKVSASENYPTLTELAKTSVAGRFDIDDSERDRLALAVAKRIADRAGEMLDAEVKKEAPDEGETLTYSVRIGSFSVSHSRPKTDL